MDDAPARLDDLIATRRSGTMLIDIEAEPRDTLTRGLTETEMTDENMTVEQNFEVGGENSTLDRAMEHSDTTHIGDEDHRSRGMSVRNLTKRHNWKDAWNQAEDWELASEVGVAFARYYLTVFSQIFDVLSDLVCAYIYYTNGYYGWCIIVFSFVFISCSLCWYHSYLPGWTFPLFHLGLGPILMDLFEPEYEDDNGIPHRFDRLFKTESPYERIRLIEVLSEALPQTVFGLYVMRFYSFRGGKAPPIIILSWLFSALSAAYCVRSLFYKFERTVYFRDWPGIYTLSYMVLASTRWAPFAYLAAHPKTAAHSAFAITLMLLYVFHRTSNWFARVCPHEGSAFRLYGTIVWMTYFVAWPVLDATYTDLVIPQVITIIVGGYACILVDSPTLTTAMAGIIPLLLVSTVMFWGGLLLWGYDEENPNLSDQVAFWRSYTLDLDGEPNQFVDWLKRNGDALGALLGVIGWTAGYFMMEQITKASPTFILFDAIFFLLFISTFFIDHSQRDDDERCPVVNDSELCTTGEQIKSSELADKKHKHTKL